MTDLPSCQPSKEIFDITIRGPKLDRLSEYGEILQSVYDAIRASKSDGISTGLLIETQAYFGVFQDKRVGEELPAGNLNTSLEGQVAGQPDICHLPGQGRGSQDILRSRRSRPDILHLCRRGPSVHHLQ